MFLNHHRPFNRLCLQVVHCDFSGLQVIVDNAQKILRDYWGVTESVLSSFPLLPCSRNLSHMGQHYRKLTPTLTGLAGLTVPRRDSFVL